MTLYDLKPAFQRLLRPATFAMDRAGITANQVTLAAAVVSVVLGLVLWHFGPSTRGLYALLPIWLLLRMALNAIDGMLAREFGHKSPLGAYLNEISDVVSDAALILPFAAIAPFSPIAVVLVAMAAAVAEFSGVLALMVDAERRYDGPFGKSDRALALGVLGTWIAMTPSLPSSAALLLPLMLALLCLTIFNRIRSGLATAGRAPQSSSTPDLP